MAAPQHDLRRFHQDADPDALLAHAPAAGQDAGEVRAALAHLQPIFAALAHGEHPDFASLDRAALQLHAGGTAYAAQAMAGSDRADLRSAGFQVIGLLDDPHLLDILLEALRSEVTWLRLSAVEALGRMSAAYSRPALEAMVRHDDSLTRRAAAEALARLGS